MGKIATIIKNIFVQLVKFIAIFGALIVLLYLFYHLIDFAFKGILPFNSRAVLANFIIFAGIITFVAISLVHAPSLITKMQEDIVSSIKNSEEAKADSETKLEEIQNSLSNLETDIDSLITESNERAKKVGEKIISDAEQTVSILKENTQKAISNSQILLKNDLIRRACLVSIEVAKSHVQEELNRNTNLHDKLINESLEQVEGVELT